jgi:CHAT domain-containing protein/Tfp pilus assembly protein PilF
MRCILPVIVRFLSLLVGVSVLAAGGCGDQASPPAAPKQSARPILLHLGTVAEAALAGSGRHVYGFDLPLGRYAELSVEQKGIDAVVRLEDAAGRRLTEVDSTNGPQGPESLVLLGQTLQPLRLVVMATNPQAAPGHYAIRVSALRGATKRDCARVQAERIFEQGEELRRRGDGDALRRAVDEHLRALGEFRSLADRRREADTLDRLGRIHLLLGDVARAHEAYWRAVPLFRELDTGQPLLDALNGLGQASRSLGRPAEALTSYREALEIQTWLGDERATVTTWINIGRLQAAQGEAEEAFRSYDQALTISRKMKEQEQEGVTLANMGRLYASLGETGRALHALEEAAARLEPRESPYAAAALTDLGLTQAISGYPRDGLATLHRALRLQERAGDRSGKALTLNDIGWINLQAGATGEAKQHFQSALALYEQLGRRPNQATVLANLGQVAARQGRPRAALALYNRALPLLVEAGDHQREASVLFDRARAWRQLGDLTAARQNAEAALARIETLRGKPGCGELRASFLASWQEIYGLLIDTLLELDRSRPGAGYAAEALGASERARARSLLDALTEGAGSRNDPDPALLAREAEVGRQLAAAEQDRQHLAETGAPADRQAEAMTRVDDLLRERERLEAELRQSMQGTEPEHILTFREIQREVVAPGTLLLEYSLGEARSFLWAVAPDRLDVFVLPPRARLEKAARSAHELLSSQDLTLAGPPAEAALAELSKLLLAPVADRLASQRLLIVPDGALSYVPFAALPRPDSGAPLITAHEIVELPSASTLAALRRRRNPAPAGIVAVVAAPIVDPPLPFSGEEAAAIKRLVPAGRSFEALGAAASRETVLSGVLANYRIVHFATHGVIDSEHPALSGLVLSRVDAKGKRQEPFLRAYEIRRLHLPADLVVLSACRTALGKEVRGEGLMGLTQSFFQAGTRRVVVSLWPVDDRATAELMERFYHFLLTEGRSPAAALRAAQISLRQTAPFQSPASWAGFVLQGDF